MAEESDSALPAHGSRRRGTEIFHRGLERLGYELVPHRSPAEKEAERELSEHDLMRARMLARRGIGLVLDVGADGGQFGTRLRRSGYGGRIVSFEPRADAFARVEAACAEDADWSCRQLALGSSAGTAEINVSRNEHSSSMLPMAERHREVAPRSKYVGRETINVAPLDSVIAELEPPDRVFLKMDTQGFELEVLKGAEASLPRVEAIEAELSLAPLYEGAPGYMELLGTLSERGFRLAGVERELVDPDSGELLQANGIFVRG